MRLEPLLVWFKPAAGALLPQLDAFLGAEAQRRTAGEASAAAATRAEVLRWAITAADAERGLRIEAVLVLEPSPVSR